MINIQKVIAIILLTGQVIMSQNLKELVSQFREAEAPDKRLAIFNVNAELIDGKVILTGEVSDSKFKEKLLESIKFNLTIDIEDKIIVLPEEELGNKTYALVKLSVCNIRSKPEHSAELSTQSTMGTPLKVLKKQGSWYLVQTPDEYLGWVDSEGIYRFTKEELREWNSKEKIIFTDLYGLIYADKTQKETISDVVATNLMILEKEERNFYKIKLPNGNTGYVKKKQAKKFSKWLEDLTYNPESVIESAKKFMGFPYLWGGTSIKGIDCSGFMRTIFLINGLILPRDADQQSKVGVEVPLDDDLSQLKKGDLIFFGKKADELGPEKITHVGIYIGNKLLLHSSGYVKIDTFDVNNPEFNNELFSRIVKVKRIFGQPEVVENLKLTNNKFYQQ